MDAIERENSTLKGVLPKIYAKESLDQQTLGGLIDLIADTAIGDAAAQWGFYHLSHFAAEYQELFAELPSQTARAAITSCVRA